MSEMVYCKFQSLVLPSVSVNGMITTTEAALILSLTDRQIRNMRKAGIIKGEKFGDVWLIDKSSVKIEKQRRSAKSRNGDKPKSGQKGKRKC